MTKNNPKFVGENGIPMAPRGFQQMAGLEPDPGMSLPRAFGGGYRPNEPRRIINDGHNPTYYARPAPLPVPTFSYETDLMKKIVGCIAIDVTNNKTLITEVMKLIHIYMMQANALEIISIQTFVTMVANLANKPMENLPKAFVYSVRRAIDRESVYSAASGELDSYQVLSKVARSTFAIGGASVHLPALYNFLMEVRKAELMLRAIKRRMADMHQRIDKNLGIDMFSVPWEKTKAQPMRFSAWHTDVDIATGLLKKIKLSRSSDAVIANELSRYSDAFITAYITKVKESKGSAENDTMGFFEQNFDPLLEEESAQTKND